MALKKSSKRFVLSDETRNLYGFVTKTEGIDLKAFQDNPVMLYNHDYNKLIGQWIDCRIEGRKLTASPAFDEDDTLAMQTYNKVEQGILKGASIGISPKKFDDKKSEMSACVLLEASLTPVPNNRNALAVYNTKGDKLNASEINQYLLSVELDTETSIKKTKSMNEKIIVALIALCAQVGQPINLTAETSEDEVEQAIKKAAEKVAELLSAKASLTAQIQTLEAEKTLQTENEIDQILANAVNQKVLSAGDVAAWRAFGMVNLDAMKTSLANLKPVQVITMPNNQTKNGYTDVADWGYDEYALNAPTELEQMQVTNPQKFQALLSAKQQKARQVYSMEG
jgi:HK97 family phage prohead protease